MTYMLKKLPQVHNSYIQIFKKQQRLYISVFLTKSTLWINKFIKNESRRVIFVFTFILLFIKTFRCYPNFIIKK